MSPFGPGNCPSRCLVASIWRLRSCRGPRVDALRPQLSDFSEVLGNGGEEEFVLCTFGAAQASSVQAEDALSDVSTRGTDLRI